MTITIGADVVQQIASAAGNTNDQLWPLVVLVISIPLSFYIMRRVIGMFPKLSRKLF